MNQLQEMITILSHKIAKLNIELAAAEAAAKYWKEEFERSKDDVQEEE
jgi:hypothetical protein